MGAKSSKRQDGWKCDQQAVAIYEKRTMALDGNAKTPTFELKGHTVMAKCVNVYDGDTIHITIACYHPITGELQTSRLKCRMLGYNSAELRTQDADEKAKALLAKNALMNLILDKEVQVTFRGKEKYGRELIQCSIEGTDVCSYMLANGYGKEYTGRGEKTY